MSRISNENMDVVVKQARGGATVPGAYLVQEYDDGRNMVRIADELVTERDQLRTEIEQLRAELAAVPWSDIRSAANAAFDWSNPAMEEHEYAGNVLAWLDAREVQP